MSDKEKIREDLFGRGRWTFGGDGSHWDGCENVHWDCALVHLTARIAELEKRNARLEEAGDRLSVHHVFDDDNSMQEAHCIYCGAPGIFNRELLEWEIQHSPDCPVTAWQRAKEGKE